MLRKFRIFIQTLLSCIANKNDIKFFCGGGIKVKKKIFGIILILIGAIVIAVALFMRYDANNKQKKRITAFEKTIEQLDKNPSTKASSETQPEKDVNGTIGIMTIPKIDLKVALSEGVDMATLKYAVGHFPGTAMPGQKGNFCVAGHRSYTYNEAFNRLDEVKIGDEIITKTTKGEFKYKVNEIKVVEPSQTSVLDKTDDATITLVTCTPIRVATHRLIVKGKLEK